MEREMSRERQRETKRSGEGAEPRSSDRWTREPRELRSSMIGGWGWNLAMEELRRNSGARIHNPLAHKTRDPQAKPDGSGRIRVTRSFRRSDPPCPVVPAVVSGEPWPVCSNPDEDPKPLTQNPTRWPVRPERKTRFFLCVFRWIFWLNPQGIKTLWLSLIC